MYFDKIYIDFLGEKMNYIYEDQEELRLDIFLTTLKEKMSTFKMTHISIDSDILKSSKRGTQNLKEN